MDLKNIDWNGHFKNGQEPPKNFMDLDTASALFKDEELSILLLGSCECPYCGHRCGSCQVP